MSSKSKSFQPIAARPNAAEILAAAQSVGAMETALPTTVENRAGEGRAPLRQIEPPAAAQTPQASTAPAATPRAQPEIQRPVQDTVRQSRPEDPDDEQVQFNNRISRKLDRQLAEAAKKYGSKKLAMCMALKQAGYDVPAIDLEDRRPRRR